MAIPIPEAAAEPALPGVDILSAILTEVYLPMSVTGEHFPHRDIDVRHAQTKVAELFVQLLLNGFSQLPAVLLKPHQRVKPHLLLSAQDGLGYHRVELAHDPVGHILQRIGGFDSGHLVDKGLVVPELNDQIAVASNGALTK